MGLPDCVGEPCKIVEYLIKDFESRGVILNVEDPEDEWVTTAPTP